MYDVIIIGSGPAGYTAGIYTSRANLTTLIISGFTPGGQLTTTTEIENFPGFDKGIMGPDLMEKMKQQAERFGAEIKVETVKTIRWEDNKTVKKFIVETDNQKYESKSVIIASGASSKELGIPSEEKFRGKGVSYCATCDGFFFKNKEVVVVGGGDTAMEEATFLTRFATKVTIIHRREEFRASPIMLERAQKNPKIKFLTNKTVAKILGENAISGIRLKDTKTSETSTFNTQGLFVAIGHTPNTEFLKGTLDLDGMDYVKIGRWEDNKTGRRRLQTQTSVAGIFAAGDCVDHVYRQAVVAAGMGTMAALDAQRYLEEKNT